MVEGLALRKPRPAIVTIHRKVSTICDEQGWPVPSYGVVRAIIADLDPGMVTLALEGPTSYRDKYEIALRRQDGIYGRVRHPIYGGVLLLLLAWALASSPWALIAVAAATAFFDAKRRREERWLEEQHTDYSAYRERGPRRFTLPTKLA